MTISVPETYTYLDWAATTPLCEEAAQAMAPFLAPGLANVGLGMNANSLHAPGRAAFEQLELARRSVARSIGASRPNEVVFTSGATESCNAAVLGIAHAKAKELRKRLGADAVPRVITTELEHGAVAQPAARLVAEGYDVVLLKPDRKGFVHADDLEAALDERTVLVSVQMANSEVGSIQPIEDMVKAAHGRGVPFHTDATQAVGKIPFDAKALGVDAASFSAHKVCGPKGVGALYLKARTPFEPLLLGGGQEEGRRSTTQNVCGAVGFAAALEAAVGAGQAEAERQMALRDGLYRRLAEMDGVSMTVPAHDDPRAYLPNVVHVLVKGYESETLVLRLDAMGYGVSGGSACSSHSLEPSRVLKAMGVPADDAYGAMRISIGRLTQEADLDRFAEAFKSCIS